MRAAALARRDCDGACREFGSDDDRRALRGSVGDWAGRHCCIGGKNLGCDRRLGASAGRLRRL